MPDSFKDQFAPFRHFGCDFKDQYKGTLFRFPLRTTSLARRSEISKKSYTVFDIQKTLNDLVSQLSNHLIFLRSVKCIEIYSSKIGEKPYLLHRAISTITEKEGQNDQSLLQYFEKKSNTPRDAFYEKLLATPDKRLPTQSYKLKVLVDSYGSTEGMEKRNDESKGDRKGIGMDKDKEKEREIEKGSGEMNERSKMHNFEDDVIDMRGANIFGEKEEKEKKGDRGEDDVKIVETEQRYGKEERIEESKKEKRMNNHSNIDSQEIVEFLVVSGLMGGEARRVACEESSRHLKLVPLGAVAACISKKSRRDGINYPSLGYVSLSGMGSQSISRTGLGIGSCFPSISGQAFCFLPLPVRTQLPVHTNAYWELSANRRDIWR